MENPWTSLIMKNWWFGGDASCMELPPPTTYHNLLVMTKLCEGLLILGSRIGSSHLWWSVSAKIIPCEDYRMPGLDSVLCRNVCWRTWQDKSRRLHICVQGNMDWRWVARMDICCFSAAPIFAAWDAWTETRQYLIHLSLRWLRHDIIHNLDIIIVLECIRIVLLYGIV